MPNVFMLSAVMLNAVKMNVIMLSVIVLNAVMLNPNMLNAVMQNVVAPYKLRNKVRHQTTLFSFFSFLYFLPSVKKAWIETLNLKIMSLFSYHLCHQFYPSSSIS